MSVPRLIEYNGKNPKLKGKCLHVRGWASLLGCSRWAVYHRSQAGRPIDEMVAPPRRLIEYNGINPDYVGVSMGAKDWAKILLPSEKTIRIRSETGIPIDAAVRDTGRRAKGYPKILFRDRPVADPGATRLFLSLPAPEEIPEDLEPYVNDCGAVLWREEIEVL